VGERRRVVAKETKTMREGGSRGRRREKKEEKEGEGKGVGTGG